MAPSGVVAGTAQLVPAGLYASHHGDHWAEHEVKPMSGADPTDLEYLQSLPAKYHNQRPAIVVCHSAPTIWRYPEPAMLDAVDEVWVPSAWQRDMFVAAGVNPDKLVVVPEGWNTSLFDPSIYAPLNLTNKAQLVFGASWAAKQASRHVAYKSGQAGNMGRMDMAQQGVHKVNQNAADPEQDGASSGVSIKRSNRLFVFIRNFKRELHKG